jgi:hypothetical protein
MAKTAKVVRIDLPTVVDQLGAIKAQLSALKKQEEALKAQLLESGYTEVDGSLFRATISTCDVESVDWKSIAIKLEPSHQLISGNTTHASRTTIKVVARKV